MRNKAGRGCFNLSGTGKFRLGGRDWDGRPTSDVYGSPNEEKFYVAILRMENGIRGQWDCCDYINAWEQATLALRAMPEGSQERKTAEHFLDIALEITENDRDKYDCSPQSCSD